MGKTITKTAFRILLNEYLLPILIFGLIGFQYSRLNGSFLWILIICWIAGVLLRLFSSRRKYLVATSSNNGILTLTYINIFFQKNEIEIVISTIEDLEFVKQSFVPLGPAGVNIKCNDIWFEFRALEKPILGKLKETLSGYQKN